MLPFRAPPKTLPLLALLLVRDGAWTRESLAFALWPDCGDAEARANVRRHLHQLTTVLPPAPRDRPWIVTEGAHVRWNADADAEVDLVRFRAAYTEGDFAAAARAYGGELLAGVNDDCVLQVRESLRAQYVDALLRALDKARDEGDERAAIGFADRVLLDDPWREDALRAAMSARFALGDRAGAVAQYERFRDQLRAELDVTPAPETAALYDVIRRDAVAPRAQVSVRFRELPFAGRERALGSLLRRWEQAGDGNGTTVFVVGAAGIGKTRLIAEACSAIRAQGGRVFRGGTAYGEPQPYQAVVEVLRDALPALLSTRIPDLWLGAISAIVPDLRARRPHLRQPAKLGPERERNRLFEAVAESLATLSRARPLCVVLEDVQWSGTATRALIDYLARRIGDVPLLLIASLRSEEPRSVADSLVRALERDGIATSAALGPLDASAVRAVVADAFPAGAQDVDARTERLHRVSGGNPLFLGEAIRDALEGGERDIPASLRAAIDLRLARVDDAARTVAQAGAIAGTGFDVPIVCGILGWDEAEVLDGLDTLLDHHIVRRGTDRTGTEFAFAHHLVQQAVEASIEEQAARRMHRRCARVLVATLGLRAGAAADVALQFERGGVPRDAAAWYDRAATHALRVYANEAAAHAAEQGLTLTDIPEQRYALAAAREEAYRRVGDVEKQRIALDELEAAAVSAGGGERRCEVLRRRVALLHLAGDRKLERAAIEDFVRAADELRDPCRIAEAAFARAQCDSVAATAGEALDSVRTALMTARAAASVSLEIAALSLEAEVQAVHNDRSAALASIARAEMLADRAGDAFAMGRVLRSAANALFNLNDDDATRTYATALLELAGRTGDRAAEADAHARLGTMHGRRFELDAADEHYGAAHELYVRLGDRHGAASTTLNAGHLRGIVGDWPSASEHFLRAAKLFAELGDLRREAVAHYNAGMAANESDRLDEAEREFSVAADLAQRYEAPAIYAPALAALGVVYRRSGLADDAHATLGRAVAIERGLSSAFEFATDLAEFAYAAAAAGHADDARAAVDELSALSPEAFESITFPQQIWLGASAACSALGDEERAALFATRALRCYQARVAEITDERRRACYHQMRINRDVVAQAGRWLDAPRISCRGS